MDLHYRALSHQVRWATILFPLLTPLSVYNFIYTHLTARNSKQKLWKWEESCERSKLVYVFFQEATLNPDVIEANSSTPAFNGIKDYFWVMEAAREGVTFDDTTTQKTSTGSNVESSDPHKRKLLIL